MAKNFVLILGALVVLLRAPAAEAVTIVLDNNPGGTFEGTPMGVNPATGLNGSGFNLNTAYQNLYGFASPNDLGRNNLWGESPTQVGLGIGAQGDNVKVNVFQEVGLDIFGDYWTLDSKLTFNPSTAILIDPNDHIIWDGTLTHTGKLSTNDFPHEGDAISGLPMNFSVDLNAGDKEPALIGFLSHALGGAFEEHPSVGHADAMLVILQGRVTPLVVFDEIEGSYTGLMVGLHLDGQSTVPEPATLILMGGGLLGTLGLRRKNRTISEDL